MTDRRQHILDAALACFSTRGYLATSIADIRRESGASTGSIYHFFASKGALAEALLARAVSGWAAQSGAADTLDSAEASIKASVGGLLRWGLEHQGERAFLDEIRTLALSGDDLAPVARMLAAGQQESARRYAHFVARGEVRDLPWPIAHSLILGPTYNYLRLVGRSPTSDPGAIDELINSAWRAVRSGP